MSEKTILALGFFDGIHLGHAKLLDAACRLAAEQRATPAVLTFRVHPDLLVSGRSPALINRAEDRDRLIRRLSGVQRIFYLPFDEDTMRTPWQDFLRRVREEYNAVGLVAGYDFRFGWQGEGNSEKLLTWCRENGLVCEIIPAVCLDGRAVCSTAIRAELEQGRLAAAARLLGHPHCLAGDAANGILPWPPGVLRLPAGRYTAVLTDESGRSASAALRADSAGLHLPPEWSGIITIEFTG